MNMKNVRGNKKEDYFYQLPEEKVATYPLKKRDEAKLLVYRQGNITHSRFKSLVGYLPSSSLLIFNDTRVVQARLVFYKPTGGRIELFCLEPGDKSKEINLAMQQTGSVTWECWAGNRKKWKPGMVLQQTFESNGQKITLEASQKGEGKQGLNVVFRWKPGDLTFAGIMELFGKVALPPYIKRKAIPQDRETYQTIYAHSRGAVAAPTAGLHFTEKVFDSLAKKGIRQDTLTLHTGAGTFQPVKTQNITDHPMHGEQFMISRSNIENLLSSMLIVPVGTTSLRALESLYWYGVKLSEKGAETDFFIEKLFPYEKRTKKLPSVRSSVKRVLQKMKTEKINTLSGRTEIFIFPGYTFRLAHGLITNFHLPESTLLMLVAAFIGDDWKKVYHEALENNYRFLSYGDSTLLWPGPSKIKNAQ